MTEIVKITPSISEEKMIGNLQHTIDMLGKRTRRVHPLTITEKEKMTGEIQLIDKLNNGIALKPEELMAISNYLIESRREYDPAINYSNSRAPFVDRNKIFAEKMDALIKQKAESAAQKEVSENANWLYKQAVEQYRITNHLKKGTILPEGATEEIQSYYLPLKRNELYNKTYRIKLKKLSEDGLSEDELNQIKKQVKEYKPEIKKNIDDEIYNEFATGNIPLSDYFSVNPSSLKKHLFIVENHEDEDGNKIEITSTKAYTKDKKNYSALQKKVANEAYFNKGQCLHDMKYFVNNDIAKIFDLDILYPDIQQKNIGAYRIGDLVFNKDKFDVNYDGGGFNAWDSNNNGNNNPYNLAYRDENKITKDFGISYPIGSVVYSGDAKKHFPNGQPEEDKYIYPSHVTALAAQSYDPNTDTVYSLTNDYGQLRLVDKPVSEYDLRGIFTPDDVSVLSPRSEFKYITFAKYFTPETITNLKKQLNSNGMDINDFFLNPIQSKKANLEPSLNIPLTLQPRKKQ